jgi:hypothetical protein
MNQKIHTLSLSGSLGAPSAESLKVSVSKLHLAEMGARVADLEKFLARVNKSNPEGCWLWQGRRVGPMQYAGFYVAGTVRIAHRWLYQILHGPLHRKTLVCHKCDNPACVNPDHMFLGSHKDNSHDSLRKARGANGVTQFALIQHHVVRTIRAWRETKKLTYRALGQAFGIGHATARFICIRKTYYHVV